MGYRILFVLYIVFMLFGVLNVLTGVFLAAAGDVLDKDILIAQELNAKRVFRQTMQTLFAELDKDGVGILRWNEFQKYFEDEQLRAYFMANGIAPHDARQMFMILDSSGSEEVSTEDFIRGMEKLKGPSRAITTQTLLREFRCFVDASDLEMKYIHADIAVLLKEVRKCFRR